MEIHPIVDGIPYDSYAGDIYTLDTAGITLTDGTLTAANITTPGKVTFDKLGNTASTTSGEDSIVLGVGGEASGARAVVLGSSGIAGGVDSVAISLNLGEAPTVSANNAMVIGTVFTNDTASSFQVGFGAEDFRVASDGITIAGKVNSTGDVGATGDPGSNAADFLTLLGGVGGAATGVDSAGGDGADGSITGGIGGASKGNATGGGGGILTLTTGVGGAGDPAGTGDGGDGGNAYIRTGAGGASTGGAAGSYGDVYICDTGGETKVGGNLVVDDDVIVSTDAFVVQGSVTQVGIGLTDPTSQLHILNNGTPYICNVHLDGSYNIEARLDRGATNRWCEVQFQTAGADKWMIGMADSDLLGDGTELFIGQTSGGTNPLMVFSTDNNVTINADTISAHYDLALAGDGVLCLKETATPTNDLNYGKVYTKSDNMLYFQDGAGVEHIVTAQPGTSGAIRQVVNTTCTLRNYDCTTGTAPTIDGSPPEIDEGVQVMSRTITPKVSGNLLKIDVYVQAWVEAGTVGLAALFDGSNDAIATGWEIGCSNNPRSISFSHWYTTANTNELTFTVRCAYLYINGSIIGEDLGDTLSSSITITEIAA